MKIALLYPPPWKLYAVPRICLATLAASLRRNGHDVVQRDLSIEARNRLLLSEEFLGECLEKTRRSFKSLSSRRSLTHDQQKQYYGAARWVALGDRLIETVPPKAGRLLEQRVLDGTRQTELRSLLARLQSLVSAAFYPSEWDDYRYCSSFSAFSSDQILAAIRHTEDNIFYSYFRDEVVPSLIGPGTEMVGISIGAEESVIPGLTLALLLKKASPATHVVVGGFHFTKVLDSLRKAKSLFEVVDTFVVFEGETAIVELAKAVHDGSGFDKVPNLVYLDNGEVRVNEPFHVEDFDSIPVPDFDGLPMDAYPGLPIETNRGCYWDRCAFCYHTYRSTRYLEEDFIDVPNFRMRSIDKVYAHLREAVDRYGVRFFHFIGFSIPPMYLENLSQMIAEDDLDIHWFARPRMERHLSVDFFRKLARAGCTGLTLSPESLVQRVLDLMEKGVQRDRCVEILRWLVEEPDDLPDFSVNIIAGFPSETEQELAETISILRELKCGGIFYPCVCYVNTKLHLFPDRYGIEFLPLEEDEDLPVRFDFKTKDGLSPLDVTRILKELEAEGVVSNHYFDFSKRRRPSGERDGGNDSICSTPLRMSEAATVMSLDFDLGEMLKRVRAVDEEIRRLRYDKSLRWSVARQRVLSRVEPCHRRETHVVFHPSSDKFLSCSAGVRAILDMLGGGTTGEEVVSGITERNPSIEREQVLGILRTLMSRGIIEPVVEQPLPER